MTAVRDWGRFKILVGDCRDALRALPDASVHCCVTSPPYFGLRDYGHAMQIGLEPTPAEYVAQMVEVFREVRRVLRDDGTLWLNLGDSYANDAKWGGTGKETAYTGNRSLPNKRAEGLKPKDLIGIPWRVAFALQADGWYLRQDIIWHKPNPMPESVRDRCTKAHEYVFLMSKSERYFYDADAMQEPAVGTNEHDLTGRTKQRGLRDTFKRNNSKRAEPIVGQSVGTHRPDRRESQWDTATRNKRSVWDVASRPYKGAHFATFPPALIEPCILAGSSERGHCPRCGARWTRQTEHTPMVIDRSERTHEKGRTRSSGTMLAPATTTTTGWVAGCACGVDPTPDVVLDPFGGSGTTAAVANQHGRHAVLCELNPAYVELAERRCAPWAFRTAA